MIKFNRNIDGLFYDVALLDDVCVFHGTLNNMRRLFFSTLNHKLNSIPDITSVYVDFNIYKALGRQGVMRQFTNRVDVALFIDAGRFIDFDLFHEVHSKSDMFILSSDSLSKLPQYACTYYSLTTDGVVLSVKRLNDDVSHTSRGRDICF